jgi:hypothetical protein
VRTVGTTRTAGAGSATEAAGGWRSHSTTSDRLGIGHDKGIGLGVEVGCRLTKVALVVVVVVVLAIASLHGAAVASLHGGHRRHGWWRLLGILKVLLVEGSNTVGTVLRILRFSDLIRGQRAESNRQSLVILLRNSQTLRLRLVGQE